MDVEFAGMLDRNETIALTDLNAAFQNPKLISIAYYEASLLVDHIVQTYGDAGLPLLQAKPYVRCHFLREHAPRRGDPAYWERFYSLEVTPEQFDGT